VDEADHLLVPCRPEWPSIELGWSEGSAPPDIEHIDDQRAVFSLRDGGRLRIDRSQGRALFTTPEPLSDVALVHPYLVPVAGVMAHWFGRHAFHAGAFVFDGGSWVVIGDRGLGKSSLLARLALDGHAVVSDDVVVTEGNRVYSGPRSVDLREDAAHELGVGELIGVMGRRERWRLALDPIEPELPLSGWIMLAWGESIETAQIPGPVRLQFLLGHHMLEIPPQRSAELLDLVTLPTVVLRRPRGWASMETAIDRLLEGLTAASDAPEP
jgi:hypothetical protein